MSGSAPIRFYFDFISTFSYIAIQQIDALAARFGRTVDWRLISLGHLFRAQGITPPPEISARFAYLARDFTRSCALAGLPCRMPATFPPEVKRARLLFWHVKARDEQAAHALARAVSSAIFGRGQSVAETAELAAAVAGVPGVSAADIAAAEADGSARQVLVAALEDAKADGMIGAPFLIVDGEPFWGADRLTHVEKILARGPVHGALPPGAATV